MTRAAERDSDGGVDLTGRVVVVTGAGSGLGRAYAHELARRGAAVVVNNRTSEGGADKALDVALEIEAAGGTAVAQRASVATPEGAASVVQAALDAFGRVDVVVSNAGGIRDRTLAKMTPEEWSEVVETHLHGAFHLVQPAFRAMKEQGYGRVVLITSSAALFGNFGQANYVAAKLGVVGLSRSIAIEGARYGIRSNVVAPLARTGPAADTLGALAAKLEPEKVAPLVAYLASEACAVSGEVFSAGGGHFARVFVGLARGWTDKDAPTAEAVRDHLDRIRDVDGARIPADLSQELAFLAETLED